MYGSENRALGIYGSGNTDTSTVALRWDSNCIFNGFLLHAALRFIFECQQNRWILVSCLGAGCFTQTPSKTPCRLLNQRAMSSVQARPAEQHVRVPLFHDWLTHLNNSRVRPCCPCAGLYKARGSGAARRCWDWGQRVSHINMTALFTWLHVFISLCSSPLSECQWSSSCGGQIFYFIKLLFSILLFPRDNAEIKATFPHCILLPCLISYLSHCLAPEGGSSGTEISAWVVVICLIQCM